MRKITGNYILVSLFVALMGLYPVFADDTDTPVAPPLPEVRYPVQDFVEAVANPAGELINVSDYVEDKTSNILEVPAESKVTSLGAFERSGSTLTIDGNGYDILVTGNAKVKGFTVGTGSTLIINNLNGSSGLAGFTSDLLGGGAIHNAGGTLIIDNSIFSHNSTIDSDLVDSEGRKGVDGGAIHNSGNTTITNSTFRQNTSTRFGSAIHNKSEGTLLIKNTVFDSNVAHSGGAIYNEEHTLMSEGGQIDILNSTFTNNTATNGFGGAIVTTNKNHSINILNSTFTKNQAELWGGAIDNIMGTMNIIDSTFIGNKTDGHEGSDGGAITNNSSATMNIAAINKDTYFAGNMKGNNFNAIRNDGTLNLNAGKGSVVIRDGISGTSSGTKKGVININNKNVHFDNLTNEAQALIGDNYYAPTDGVVEVNGKITYNTVNLYDGTLKLLGNHLTEEEYQSPIPGYDMSSAFFGAIDSTSELHIYGGSISAIDGKTKGIALGNLSLNTDLPVGLDVTGATASDKISATSITNPKNHNVVIEKINLTSELPNVDTVVATGDLKDAVTLSPTPVLSINSNTENLGAYATSLIGYGVKDDAGKLVITPDASIKTAVSDTSTSKVYSTHKNQTVTENLGSIGADNTTLGIDMNNNTLSANGNDIEGFAVNKGQTLDLSNANVEDFNGAVSNTEGTVNIQNSTVSEGTAENGGAIKNENGTVTLVDTSFEGNSANTEGGAIYNTGAVTVAADKKDVQFTENKAQGASNAIHNEGTVNLNSEYGHKIVINDGITGENGTIDINKSHVKLPNDIEAPVTGSVEINGAIKNNTVNLHRGTLKLGTYTSALPDTAPIFGTFENSSLIVDSGKIELTDGITRDTNLGNLTLNSNLDLAIDANLAKDNASVDKITADSVKSNGNNIVITDVHLLNGDKTGTTILSVADEKLKDSVVLSNRLNITKQDENSFDYLLSYSTQTGDLSFTSDIELNDAIQNAVAGSNVFDIASDKALNSSLGKLGGTAGGDINFTVNGSQNNLTADGANIAGFEVANNQTLTLNQIGNAENEASKGLSGFQSENGGAVKNEGTATIVDSVITNNKANSKGGAIYNEGTVNIVAENAETLISGNTADDTPNAIHNENATLNLNAGNKNVVINDGITGADGIININKDNINLDPVTRAINFAPASGTVEVNAPIENNTVNLYNGTLKLGSHTYTSAENPALAGTLTKGDMVNSTFNVYGGKLSLQDGAIYTTNLGNLNLQNDMKLALDANFGAKTMDKITADAFTSNGNSIKVTDINILSPATDKTFSISPLGDMDEAVKADMAESIVYEGEELAYSPIYLYQAEYDPENGTFNFTRGGSDSGSANYADYNPAIFTGPAAAQIGGYLAQLNSYYEAFGNMDKYMSLTQQERAALKMANRYAIADSSTPYNADNNANMWFRPYATFEKVPLKHGPKVENISYGSFFGGESALKDLGHGWDGVWGLYAGYNGSHQNFDRNSIYQNGGTLGYVGTLYHGNFFGGLTLNAGFSGAHANTIYGTDDFAMFATGAALKTGYNIELGDSKFILQPSYLMSYSLVKQFDYTNAADVRIDSDALHAIQIEPGLKLIANFENGWKPFIGANFVWNFIDDTKFSANDVYLPELSIKPFVRYGAGLRKDKGKYFTGHIQSYVTNGGRNGVGIQGGFSWLVGRDKTDL